MRVCLLALLAAGSASAVEPAEFHGKLDELHKKRDDAAALKEQETVLRDALKEHPKDFGVLWRAARLRHWIADDAADARLKKQQGKECWAFAEQAIALQPERVEGHYFAGLGIGVYSQAVGIMKALSEGLEGKFNSRIDKAIALDPWFEIGGGHIAKGRYFYELPWPKRDLGKSRAEYDKVIKKHPENLRALMFLAETELADGEEKRAKELIDKVKSGDVSYDPPPRSPRAGRGR